MAELGLTPRGAFLLSGDERRGALAPVSTIVLAGFVGRDGWSSFASSVEALDGLDHALDRWSRRVIEALACEFGAFALFPFGGPPSIPSSDGRGAPSPFILRRRVSSSIRATDFGTATEERSGFGMRLMFQNLRRRRARATPAANALA